mmetsp:Transcript_21155/g.31390  ORF Transcript_21155/g.31390 Transcript_21155/m.31390 type:complete len:109 (-) Transcript_21155:1506-1832(-)
MTSHEKKDIFLLSTHPSIHPSYRTQGADSKPLDCTTLLWVFSSCRSVEKLCQKSKPRETERFAKRHPQPYTSGHNNNRLNHGTSKNNDNSIPTLSSKYTTKHKFSCTE